MRFPKPLLSLLAFVLGASIAHANPSAKELVDRIITHSGAKVPADTVDCFKAGKPEQPITGVAVCMFATMDVLRKASAEGCNLIITHEPLYYNHRDDTTELAQDPVYLAKSAFIRDHGLTVWRFHDGVHAMQPDLILKGLVQKLGWERFQDPKFPLHFKLERMTFQSLLSELRHHLNRHAFQAIGDPEMELSSVCVVPGAAPGSFHRILLNAGDTELIIAGEGNQWETFEYVRDANLLGKRKAAVFLGHSASEELGMQCAATWMADFIREVPVRFIEAGPSFWSF